MQLRILFADDVDATAVDHLTTAGHECLARPELSAEDLPRAIGGVNVVVVRSTRVGRDALDAGTDLELVVRAGAGTDTIDLEAASERGVYVCNVPGRNAIAVAELTMGLLLAIDRGIADGAADLRAGRWDKQRYAAAQGLHGRRMAILGLGGIGLAVAERAAAFGMEVMALRRPDRDPRTVARIRGAGIRLVDQLADLLQVADVVSLHLPSGPDSRGMVDEDFLAQMPESAILLNTSRGDLIDQAAVLRAIDQRGLRLGLDVYPGEPNSGIADWHSELASHPSVVGSHHIGASTRQAQEAVAAGMVDVIDAYVSGELRHCVNLADRPLGSCSIVIRHRDQVGVLAAVLTCLREGGINVQQMQNEIFEAEGPAAAVATIRVSHEPTAQLIDRLMDIEAVYAARVRAEH